MSGQIDTADDPAQKDEPLTASSKAANAVEEFAEHLVEGVAHFVAKPRFRGWIHVYSAGVAVIAGATLVAVSWSLESTRAGLATLAYTAATVVMFAVSATYHRVPWKSAATAKWMKRADHSMIFVFIAGSYTPFALLAMPPETGRLVLSIVWGGALAGVILKMCWPSAPRWVGVPLYLLLGWVAVWFYGTILDGAGITATALLAVGGALYSVGAVLYALKWPDPWPETWGHHEFFHACTALAATCHYIAIWFAVF
jgi:hemolysin III